MQPCFSGFCLIPKHVKIYSIPINSENPLKSFADFAEAAFFYHFTYLSFTRMLLETDS